MASPLDLTGGWNTMLKCLVEFSETLTMLFVSSLGPQSGTGGNCCGRCPNVCSTTKHWN